ncbi:MAG: PP2C family protein-serine/threonine phosphatase [Chthoniobacterales bacterium]
MLWVYIFSSLLLGTLFALFFIVVAFRRKVARIEKQLAALRVEETRIFDFLRGLGETFSGTVRSLELQRLIVEGAVKTLDAHGGGLYLVDKSDTNMVPAFISEGCPPLLKIPKDILEQAESVPTAIDGYVKLHNIKRGEGLLGEVWERGEIILLSEDAAKDSEKLQFEKTHSVIAAPLIYRKKTLALLAVAIGEMGRSFSEEDLVPFRAIVEQSAFALYNEAIYREASEKRRLDSDLQTARDIQDILLPSADPDLAGYEVSGTNIPARQVSGDFYDYIRIDESRIGIVIADVSGKGVPASLIMAMCRSVTRSQAQNIFSPAEVLKRVNRQLYPDIKEDMFISMAYLILNCDNGEIVMARAGHDPPFKYRASDTAVEEIKPPGLAVGIDSGPVFDRMCEDFSFQLDSGDCLLLYTDGAVEALDAKDLEYGAARMTQGLQSAAAQGAAAVIQYLTDDLKTFIGDSLQYDDITLIAICKT